MIKRYFDILGIPPTKDEKAIKRAYRRKALQYHPDKNKSNEANAYFLKVSEAYDQIMRALNHGKNKTTHTTVDQDYQGKQYSFNQFDSSPTKEELFKERLRRAKMRYEYLKNKEAAENEQYYQKISFGTSWKYFKVVMVGCSLFALLFSVDFLILPTRYEEDRVIKANRILSYSGIEYRRIIPIRTENNGNFWVQSSILGPMETAPKVYLEKTFFFKDVKRIWIWHRNQWLSTKVDFTVTGSFPLVPLFLLVPFITFLLKNRTLTYSLLFNISLYFYGIILFYLLYANDRWAHLLTFGYL